jgi:hypothetical protein
VLDEKNPRVGYTETEFRKRRGRLDPIARCMVALAGHEAEHRVFARPLTLLPREDYATVMSLGVSPRSANLIGWLTRRYVVRCMPHIRNVAKALLLRGRLDRRQFLAALRAKA